MKHNMKITLLLLGMFFITQFIGLYLLSVDPLNMEVEINGTIQEVPNPQLSFIQPPQDSSPAATFGEIIIAFIVAISLLLLFKKLGLDKILKIWFFSIIVLALWLVFYTLEIVAPIIIDPTLALIIPLVIALPLAYIKLFRGNFIVHNLTELLIYPGIAIIFVSFLSQWNAFWNVAVIVSLLLIISAYDMWAVWHSGLMQKMAKYQMDKLKIFSGFFVPYISKKQRDKIKKMKKSELKKTKIKANVAILGGGDIIFPIIAGGIMLKTFGWIPAVMVVIGTGIGLSYLLFLAEKKKFYPAMPFISAGIFAAMILYALIF